MGLEGEVLAVLIMCNCVSERTHRDLKIHLKRISLKNIRMISIDPK